MDYKSKCIGLLSITLIFLIILVETNLITTFDNTVYNILVMNMNDGLTSVVKAITVLGGEFITLAVIVILMASYFLKKMNLGAVIAITVFFNNFMNGILKSIFQRPRPEVLKLTQVGGYSFPSGHAMAAASLFGILIYIIMKSKLDKSLKYFFSAILALLVLLVGLSRIYLGAHYASDVLAGMIATAILLLIEIKIIEKNNYLNKKRNKEMNISNIKPIHN